VDGRRILADARAISFPRRAGSQGDRRARRVVAEALGSAGLEVNQEEFSYDIGPAERALRAVLLSTALLTAASGTLALRSPAIALLLQALGMLAGVVLVAWAPGIERIYRREGRTRTANVVGRRPSAQPRMTLIVVAHHDSKSQNLPFPWRVGLTLLALGGGGLLLLLLAVSLAGLGPAGVETVLDARRRGGPFAHLSDFVFRTHLGRAETRALILCGAMDFAGRTRPALMLELDLALAASGGLSGGGLISPAPTVPDVVRDFTPLRKYSDERRELGFSVGEHIMTIWRGGLAGRVDTDSRHLARLVGRRVRIAGVLEARRTTQTQKGRRMMFLTLDDEYGLFEASVFPDVCATSRHVGSYGPYIIAGRVEEKYDTVTLTADRITLWNTKRPAEDMVHGLH